jgi:uncharacterized protein YbaA (DUF1428 family)
MAYVDGYVIPVPKKNLRDYAKMARLGAKVWRKHGALDYKECVGDDMQTQWGIPFPRTARCKRGETVVFAFIVYKSRAHRDAVNAKVMKDPMMQKAPKKMPFDIKRMAFGGFKVLVDA